MRAFFRSLIASLFPAKPKPRIFLDACTFDPDKIQKNGRAVLLFTHNEVSTIYERVSREMADCSGVVVLDQGSDDGTPVRAAEAGAVVVLQESDLSQEEAVDKAMRMARLYSDNVIVRR